MARPKKVRYQRRSTCRNLLTVDNVSMALAARQYSARGGLRSEPVEHAVHVIDIGGRNAACCSRRWVMRVFRARKEAYGERSR